MSEIAKLIIECGVVPVILASLIIVMINVAKNLKAGSVQQEKRLTDLTTLMLNMQKNQENANKHSKEEETEGRRINTFIDSQLKALLKEAKSCRTSMYLFHNGGYSINGRSFQRMTMTNEIVDFETVPIIGQFQAVPRKMFSIVDEKLTQDGHFYIDDIDELKQEDTGTYYWLSIRKTKSIYMQVLVDNIEGVLLGFVTVEYLKCPQIETSKCKLLLSKTAQRISGALQINGQGEINNEHKNF